VFKYPNTGLSI